MERDHRGLIVPGVDVKLLERQGKTLVWQRNHEGAVVVFRRLVDTGDASTSEWRWAHWFIARSLIELGRYEEAVEWADRAIGLADEDDTEHLRADACWLKGKALLRAGRPLPAAQSLSEAVQGNLEAVDLPEVMLLLRECQAAKAAGGPKGGSP